MRIERGIFMIDYSRLSEREYLNEVKEDVRKVTDTFILMNILKGLSYKIAEHTIEPAVADELLTAVKERISVLTDARIHKNTPNNEIDRNNQHKNGRTLSLSPTAVSNRHGRVALIFLAVNISIVAAMYAMLAIAHFIK